MGSIFHSENSGVLALLVGMIALVMFGVLVTLLMDGSISLAGEKEEHDLVMVDQRERIVMLETERKLLAERRTTVDALREAETSLETVRGMLEAAHAKLAAVTGQLRAEERALDKLDETFADYRADYRRELWLAAIGESLGEMTTRAGRTYRDVTIKTLSATEFVFDHAGGSGRIPVAELPAALREAYQLDIDEAARLVEEARERREAERAAAAERQAEAKREEEAAQRRMAAERRRNGLPSAEEEVVAEAQREEIALLRSEVATMSDSLDRLEHDVADARRRIYGRDRSPAGSLETWEQRHARLAAQAVKARAILRAREDRLQELDPDYKRPVRPGRGVR